MSEMYQDGKYAEANPTWHEEDAVWKAQQIKSILIDNGVKFENLCEVGCGAGGILVELSKAFPDVRFTGYDISPQAHEMAARKKSSKIHFQLKDLLAEEGLQFDIVSVIDVIEHVEDYLGFVKKLKRYGTFKVFHIPLDLSVQSLARMKPIMNLRKAVGHIHYFNKDLALAALVDCGYDIIDWRYTASRLELPNQAVSSRLMANPRRWLHKVSPDLAVRILGGYSLIVLAK
ncbi:class I SAM-dependent methyltransferase [Paeniroseomonas aquatica]|uniref:Class I SAM-dependent methyltransferase n=1 Tax=Paeniroseomonas aquatica TaxID=373043 RepID=A0ABT8A8N5_9PROT|nr:class I SAM-dependent methyltransferase [Paeniroseomonas aquatica]MDN3566074.1 class I SAM-dependent methyltransferase [Paeniroseomonas aquatica]